jgi:hypothetical protein
MQSTFTLTNNTTSIPLQYHFSTTFTTLYLLLCDVLFAMPSESVTQPNSHASKWSGSGVRTVRKKVQKRVISLKQTKLASSRRKALDTEAVALPDEAQKVVYNVREFMKYTKTYTLPCLSSPKLWAFQPQFVEWDTTATTSQLNTKSDVFGPISEETLARVSTAIEFTPMWGIVRTYMKCLTTDTRYFNNRQQHEIYGVSNTIVSRFLFTRKGHFRMPNLLIFNSVIRPREMVIQNHYQRFVRRHQTGTTFINDRDFLFHQRAGAQPGAHFQSQVSNTSTLYFPDWTASSSFKRISDLHISTGFYAVYDASNIMNSITTAENLDHSRGRESLKHLIIACQVLQTGGHLLIPVFTTGDGQFTTLTKDLLLLYRGLFQTVELCKSPFINPYNQFTHVQCVCVGFRGCSPHAFEALCMLYDRITATPANVQCVSLYSSDRNTTFHAENTRFDREVGVPFRKGVLNYVGAYIRMVASIPESLLWFVSTLRFIRRSRLSAELSAVQDMFSAQVLEHLIGATIPVSVGRVGCSLAQQTCTRVSHIHLINIPGTQTDSIVAAIRKHCLKTRSTACLMWFYNRRRQEHVVVHSYPHTVQRAYPVQANTTTLVLTQHPHIRFLQCMKQLLGKTRTNSSDGILWEWMARKFRMMGIYTVDDFFESSERVREQITRNLIFCPQAAYLTVDYNELTPFVTIHPNDIIDIINDHTGAAVPHVHEHDRDSISKHIRIEYDWKIQKLYRADYARFTRFNRFHCDYRQRKAIYLRIVDNAGPVGRQNASLSVVQLTRFLLREYIPILIHILHIVPAHAPANVYIYYPSSIANETDRLEYRTHAQTKEVQDGFSARATWNSTNDLIRQLNFAELMSACPSWKIVVQPARTQGIDYTPVVPILPKQLHNYLPKTGLGDTLLEVVAQVVQFATPLLKGGDASGDVREQDPPSSPPGVLHWQPSPELRRMLPARSATPIRSSVRSRSRGALGPRHSVRGRPQKPSHESALVAAPLSCSVFAWVRFVQMAGSNIVVTTAERNTPSMVWLMFAKARMLQLANGHNNRWESLSPSQRYFLQLLRSTFGFDTKP